ncbi:MAG: hypothetical protein OXI48_08740, partial [bacterium]|nr:hypothetical protein [bacterium]
MNSDSGLLTRPGCGRGWSKHNCTGDHYGYWFWDGWDIAVGLVEDLRPAAQRSAAGFSPRTPEEALEWAKQANFGNEGEPFTPFADVSAGGGGAGGGERASVTEGEAARFTVTLTPPPSGPRAVTVNVARRGGSAPLGVEAHLGPRTVMVGASGSAQFEVPTADNDHVGHNGYLHAVVAPHPAYRVSAFGGSAEVDVLSDDAEAAPDAVRVRRVTDTAATVEWDPTPGAASYEVIWIEGASTTTSTAFTAGTSIELSGLEPATAYDVAVLDDLWDRVGSAELLTLPAGGGEKVYPTLNVAAGAGVAEGAAATFTLTAAPAPEAPFAVTVWVSQRGDHAAAGERGERAVTVPVSGSVTFTVATADDDADEPDGAVVATLGRSKLGHSNGPNARAEVAVADDDGSATPEVSVAAGGPVAEGTAATFTVTADPAPAAPLTVNVTVSQDGDYGAATGARTVTIPTSGTATLTVATEDDDADEPRGSVSVEVATGDGYTVSATQGRATVQVADDDEPTPEVSVTAGGGVTEGGAASFTVTADPPPPEPLKVSVTVSQTGDFGAATGARSVTVLVSGSTTLTVGTADDDADEADGSVTVTVEAGDGYTVSATQGAAKVSVADDDDPPPATPEVSVTVSQSGDYGAVTGSRTVTVPTSGSAVVTV